MLLISSFHQRLQLPKSTSAFSVFCFLLWATDLILIDFSFQRRKERGRIQLNSVNVIENAVISSVPLNSSIQDLNSSLSLVDNNCSVLNSSASGYPFQLCYIDSSGQEYTLYLITAREQDRTDWLIALREGSSSHFHIVCEIINGFRQISKL